MTAALCVFAAYDETGRRVPAGYWTADGWRLRVRRWGRLVLGMLGLVLLACSGLVWWSAEQALGPAPEIESSSRGGLVSCGYRPGLTSCDAPSLAGSTIAVIVAPAVVGAGLVAVVLAGTLWRRRA